LNHVFSLNDLKRQGFLVDISSQGEWIEGEHARFQQWMGKQQPMYSTRAGDRPMTLRLLLVSMVAGLGISAPGWPTLEGWIASSQKWVNTRLAEMDHRRSDEANYVVIHDLLKVEMDRARAAREASRPAKRSAQIQAVGTALLANARSIRLEQTSSPARIVDADVVTVRRTDSPRPTFEPIVVGDRLDFGVAYDLNFRNEGLNLPSSLVMLPLPTPATQPADLARLAVDRYGSSSLTMLRSLGRSMRDVAQRELAARQQRAAREANALAFESMGHADNLYFVDVPAPAVAEARSLVVAEASPFEAMEASENLYFADVAAPIVAEAAPVAPTAATVDVLPDDLFAPANSIAATSPTEPSRDVKGGEPSINPRPEVNRAVRLTREALFAWVNVLSGPALVTVAPSSSVTR